MKYTNKNFLDEFFSEKLENFKKKPSAEVWENLAKKLDKPSGGFALNGFSRMLLFGVFAISTGITSYFLYSSKNTSQSKPQKLLAQSEIKTEFSDKNINLSSNNNKSAPNFVSANQIVVENPSKKALSRNLSQIKRSNNSNSLNIIDISNPISANVLSEKNIVSGNLGIISIPASKSSETNYVSFRGYSDNRDQSYIDKISLLNRNISDNLLSLKFPDTSNIQLEIKYREELFKMKGFHVAPIYQINSKWISKQNTYEAFGKSRLAYKIGLGNAYGFAMGYDFSTQFGIQFEYIMQSEHGQNYEDVINKKNVKRNVILNYMQFPLLLKLKNSMMSGLTNKPFAVNYIAGLQYGVLKSAYLELNSNTSNIKNRFQNHDFAAIFGIETDLFLTRRMFLSTGIRFEYGLLDINADGWKIKNGGSSQNFISGMNCGLHYMIF